MWQSIQQFCTYYTKYYWTYLVKVWDGMTPMGYGCLLIAIGVFGWFLMKGTLKKC